MRGPHVSTVPAAVEVFISEQPLLQGLGGTGAAHMEWDHSQGVGDIAHMGG